MRLMRTWIVDHVPHGTPIAEEVKAPELRPAEYPTLQRFDLPHDGTVVDYVAHGYHYFLVNAYVALTTGPRLVATRNTRRSTSSSAGTPTLLHEVQGGAIAPDRT